VPICDDNEHIDIKDLEKNDLYLKKQLTEGASGSIFLALYKGKERVVKFQVYDKNSQEIFIACKMSLEKIGPKIYGHFFIKSLNGIDISCLVMQKLFKSLSAIQYEVEIKTKKMLSLGYKHNDLHDDNIMIDKNGNVFLIDFGMSTKLQK